MQKRVYGRKKQEARFGHTKIQGKSLLVRGLNALAATISTPLGAPVIAATRLRGGSAGSARGAVSFATEAVSTCTDLRVSPAPPGADGRGVAIRTRVADRRDGQPLAVLSQSVRGGWLRIAEERRLVWMRL